MSTPTYRSGSSSGRASVPDGSAGGYRSSGRAQVRPPSADGYGSGPPTGPGGGGRLRTRPRPRWGRIALVAGLALLLVAVVAGVGGFLYYRGLDSDLKRTDAFGKIGGQRPASVVSGAQN